jgi:hypothetical protein
MANTWLDDAIAAANIALGDCGLFVESRAMLREIYLLTSNSLCAERFTVITHFIQEAETKNDVLDIIRDFLHVAYDESRWAVVPIKDTGVIQ